MCIIEQEQGSNNDSESSVVDVEQIFSENGASPELKLTGLSDQNMIIAANKLRNNVVRE
jgi:hypothetical protein